MENKYKNENIKLKAKIDFFKQREKLHLSVIEKYRIELCESKTPSEWVKLADEVPTVEEVGNLIIIRDNENLEVYYTVDVIQGTWLLRHGTLTVEWLRQKINLPEAGK